MSEVKFAKEKKIYVLEKNGTRRSKEGCYPEAYGLDLKVKIVETNLYDHVMESVDITTTPRGVAPRFFIEKEEVSFWKEEVVEDNARDLEEEEYDSKEEFEEAILKAYVEDLGIYFMENYHNVTLDDFDRYGNNDYTFEYYVISSWGTGGNNYKNGKNDAYNCFATEDEAKDSLFIKTLEYNFARDCNRDTTYFNYIEDAQEEVMEFYCESWKVDEEVAESILSKRRKLDEIKEKMEDVKRKEYAIILEKELELAKVYANLIEPKKEPFKETMSRLSKALDEKLSKRLFISTVKIIRSRIKN